MFDFVEHCSCVNDAKWVYLFNDTLSNGLCHLTLTSNLTHLFPYGYMFYTVNIYCDVYAVEDTCISASEFKMNLYFPIS